jgi:hypothetical protein
MSGAGPALACGTAPVGEHTAAAVDMAAATEVECTAQEVNRIGVPSVAACRTPAPVAEEHTAAECTAQGVDHIAAVERHLGAVGHMAAKRSGPVKSAGHHPLAALEYAVSSAALRHSAVARLPLVRVLAAQASPQVGQKPL